MVNQGLSNIWGKTAVWNGKTVKSKLKNLSWAMEAIKIVEKLQQNKSKQTLLGEIKEGIAFLKQ